jgi:hypothetical protein
MCLRFRALLLLLCFHLLLLLVPILLSLLLRLLVLIMSLLLLLPVHTLGHRLGLYLALAPCPNSALALAEAPCPNYVALAVTPCSYSWS